MSYVGEPFEHDVFFSYARGETATGAQLLSDWSRNVIGLLRDLLKTARGDGLTVFFDETGVRPGAALPPTFRTAAEKSACLVVLMSPYYPQSDWCKEELTTFFAKADQDGRSKGHCVPILVQSLAEAAWPSLLKDERGGPVHYEDLLDEETQLPLGLTDFDDRALKAAVRKAFISIDRMLLDVRDRLEARRTLDATQQPADLPVIYLQARLDDRDAWTAACATLRHKAIPLPLEMQPMSNISLTINEDYEHSNGLALLRHDGVDISRQVKKAYLDRQWLLQEKHRNLPWAILDSANDELLIAKAYRVPRVTMSTPDWPDRLLSVLGLTPQAGR